MIGVYQKRSLNSDWFQFESEQRACGAHFQTKDQSRWYGILVKNWLPEG
jgi:hypothetical protein